MTRRATATALALSSVALTAAACGGDKVDRRDLEAKIAAFVHQQTGTTIAVSCPDRVRPDKGTRVTCTTVLSGAETDIEILFTDKGKFRIASTRLRMG
ncbi:MAG TPA: DUF4333 domain-containing protein [Baekduia sp.]|nr:DUF4333 domain-containing protein [Baekduia sp.]